MKKILKQLAYATRPQLANILGANRPLPTDWRQDPTPRPPVKWFNANSRESMERRKKNSDAGSRYTGDLRRPYRILSLDGGGVRGAITITLLNRIVNKYPNFLDKVDFIIGTSAGGLLTLMLSAGYSPKECAELYTWATPHIFAYDPWRVINPFRSKYSDKTKEELMRLYFGDRTMMDLEKTCAVVAFRLDGRKSLTHSFFNTDGWRPAVFTNMPRGGGLVDPDIDLKVWDAAMRTSAAPTFFPVYRGYVDGGIVANNPSVIGASKAMAHYPNVTTRNLAVLSVGALLVSYLTLLC